MTYAQPDRYVEQRRANGFQGTVYGIALVMTINYWTMLSVFGALGASGLISPMLAPRAADLLFGSVAACMPLTVRT
jgi:predicted phage tail protein